MAGTGAPRRAEGLLIPAFKSTCLNMSPSPSPWGFAFSTADALYRPPFPQPLLFIKFYMKSWAVNQCSERRRRGWREEGDVQRGSERLWKSCIVTNRCFDLRCLCLIGGIWRIHMKGKVDWYFSRPRAVQLGRREDTVEVVFRTVRRTAILVQTETQTTANDRMDYSVILYRHLWSPQNPNASGGPLTSPLSTATRFILNFPFSDCRNRREISYSRSVSPGDRLWSGNIPPLPSVFG